MRLDRELRRVRAQRVLGHAAVQRQRRVRHQVADQRRHGPGDRHAGAGVRVLRGLPRPRLLAGRVPTRLLPIAVVLQEMMYRVVIQGLTQEIGGKKISLMRVRTKVSFWMFIGIIYYGSTLVLKIRLILDFATIPSYI